MYVPDIVCRRVGMLVRRLVLITVLGRVRMIVGLGVKSAVPMDVKPTV